MHVRLALVMSVMVMGLSLLSSAYAHHLLEDIPVSKRPMKMSIAGDLLFTSSMAYPHISIIDMKTDENVGFITTSQGGIMAVEAVPEKNKVYVAPLESGTIEVFDLNTKSYLKTIWLLDAKISVWHSPRDDTQVYLTLLTGGWSLDYNPKNDYLYVADYNSNMVYVIDTNEDTLVESIPVPRHPFAVKADPVTETVLVTSMATNDLTFIKRTTDIYSQDLVHKVSKSIKMCCGPWGLDIDPQLQKAYVTERGHYSVAVVDMNLQRLVDRIPLEDRTQAVSVDTEEHQVYVSYLNKKKIVKIDGNIDEVVSTFETEGNPWDLAVNPKTHKLYASMKSQDVITVFGPRSFAKSLPVVTLQTPVAVVGIVSVHGYDVDVSTAYLDVAQKGLYLNAASADGGEIVVVIPRFMLDSIADGKDAQFGIYVGGTQASYKDMGSDDEVRALSIKMPKGSQDLLITGNRAVQSLAALRQ